MGETEFILVLKQPLELVIMAVIALIITELIKWPIKAKAKPSNVMSWIYILISIVICTAVFFIYYALILPGGIKNCSYEKWVGLVAAEQLTYNYVWDKGLKKVISGIVAKITKKKPEDIEKAIDSSGLGEVLDKADSKIKEKQDKPNLIDAVDTVTEIKQVTVLKKTNGRPDV